MRRLVTLVLFLAVSHLAAEPSTQPEQHAKWGLPWKKSTATKIIVSKPEYTVGFNKRYKCPAWVTYRLSPEDIKRGQERKDNWRPDPALPADIQSEEKDYVANEWDQGHLCPNLHRSWKPEAADTTFVYSNCTPQNQNLNRGFWKKMESMAANWATGDHGNLWVCVGTIFKPKPGEKLKTLDHSKGKIPTHFWMVIYDDDPEGVIAFVVENKPTNSTNPFKYITSVDHIEKLTGLNILSGIENEEWLEGLEQPEGEWPKLTTN